MHGGHRERLRKRLESEGLESFAPHEVLELILFYSIPRTDTNPIAHRLLERFGSLSAVLEAPVSDLVKVEGVGANSAALLSMIPQLTKRYMTDKNNRGTVLDSVQKLGEFIMPYYIGSNVEKFYLICLDKKCKLLNCALMAEGSFDNVTVDMRLVCKTALDCSATSVVLSHNHAQGFALPSANDILVTEQVVAALKLISVDVVDHIIVAGDDYISLLQSGYFVKV
ncbi:MAG: RadC family protein [Oscillospiraceae bacterium]|nr:RadC family protein [Oscillospiraceae bacterium]